MELFPFWILSNNSATNGPCGETVLLWETTSPVFWALKVVDLTTNFPLDKCAKDKKPWKSYILQFLGLSARWAWAVTRDTWFHLWSLFAIILLRRRSNLSWCFLLCIGSSESLPAVLPCCYGNSAGIQSEHRRWIEQWPPGERPRQRTKFKAHVK